MTTNNSRWDAFLSHLQQLREPVPNPDLQAIEDWIRHRLGELLISSDEYIPAPAVVVYRNPAEQFATYRLYRSLASSTQTVLIADPSLMPQRRSILAALDNPGFEAIYPLTNIQVHQLVDQLVSQRERACSLGGAYWRPIYAAVLYLGRYVRNLRIWLEHLSYRIQRDEEQRPLESSDATETLLLHTEHGDEPALVSLFFSRTDNLLMRLGRTALEYSQVRLAHELVYKNAWRDMDLRTLAKAEWDLNRRRYASHLRDFSPEDSTAQWLHRAATDAAKYLSVADKIFLSHGGVREVHLRNVAAWVHLDAEAAKDPFIRLCEVLPSAVSVWTTEIHVCCRPTAIHVADSDTIATHREDGPVMEYAGNHRVWCLNGTVVDEQTVMSPETLTAEQILENPNNDFQMIQIERFGWLPLLRAINAEVIDSRRNDIDGTDEVLVATERFGKRFLGVCPTGQNVCLSVPPEIDTCEEAQAWLSGDADGYTTIAAT